jgi:hypothetical protein
MVTLHPVVAYFRNPNDENEISHKSFVYVSDDRGISMACLEVLPATFSTKQLKMICNDVKYALVSKRPL